MIRAAYRCYRPRFVWASTSQKQRKRKVSFRRTKPNVSQPCRKSLKSLKALNQRFRGIVCFQWVDPHFVSPFSLSQAFPDGKAVLSAGAPFSLNVPGDSRAQQEAKRRTRLFRIARNEDAARQLSPGVEQATEYFSRPGELYVRFHFTQVIVRSFAASAWRRRSRPHPGLLPAGREATRVATELSPLACKGRATADAREPEHQRGVLIDSKALRHSLRLYIPSGAAGGR